MIVEGATERVFKATVVEFLRRRNVQRMPRLEMRPYDGSIPTSEKLKRLVTNLLGDRFDAVIALTDVYTGQDLFVDAADARNKMRAWVGANPDFYPHAAQYDFEAWLLPYWDVIQRLAGHNRRAPAGPPERVNHDNPPSSHIKEIFRIGRRPRQYSKVRDSVRILKDRDLYVAAAACPELKALLNTILTLCSEPPLP